MSTPAQQIAQWAEKLRDISAMGLIFSQNIYDRENYDTIRRIVIEMQALAGGEPLESIEPLKDTFFARPTPISTGDAAIIDEAGRILLIRRADNQKRSARRRRSARGIRGNWRAHRASAVYRRA